MDESDLKIAREISDSIKPCDNTVDCDNDGFCDLCAYRISQQARTLLPKALSEIERLQDPDRRYDLHDKLLKCEAELAAYKDLAAKYREALEEARKGLALMAEGEGDDPQTYMDMSDYHMRQIDKVLVKEKL